MRNMYWIKNIMEEIGIDYDVPFTMEIKDGNKLETKDLILRSIGCGGTDIDVIDANTNKRILDVEPIIFMLLFSDNVKIIKKPWKPEDGEKYWYVWFDENCDCCVGASHWERNSADFTRYVVKNCFKTQKEAVENADEVLKTLRGEPLVK